MQTNDPPLDYALPSTPVGRRLLTPREILFRRRLKIILLSLCVLSAIPYPTQVCPSVTVQLVDDTGKPVMDIVSIEWTGYANAGSLNSYVPFDLTACAPVPRRWIWANPLGRAVSMIRPPHGGVGWITNGTSLSFPIPVGYDFDAVAMGLTPISSTATEGSWADPKTGSKFTCYRYRSGMTRTLRFSIDPGWLATPSTTLKIILLRTTRPSPASRPYSGSVLH